MIVVIGRAGLSISPGPDGRNAPAGPAGVMALAVRRSGAAVELLAAVGDDAEGDLLAVALGRAGVGHAALLRDPAGRTLLYDATGRPLERAHQPRLEAADIEMGLRYLSDCRVLLVADEISAEAAETVMEAARFHAAAVVAVLPPGGSVAGPLAEAATLLETPLRVDAMPEDAAVDDPDAGWPDDGPSGSEAFAAMVGSYVAALDAGSDPSSAFEAALRSSAWEPAVGE